MHWCQAPYKLEIIQMSIMNDNGKESDKVKEQKNNLKYD